MDRNGGIRNRGLSRVCLSVVGSLLLSVFGCGAARSQTMRASVEDSPRPAAQLAMGIHLEARGVPNFGRVTPTLYRGGQPSPEGFETLSEMGIKIVVDTGRSKRDEALVKKLGMQYVPLPWYCPFPSDKVFAKFVELVREHPNEKVFVHCRLGDDRTGMMIAAYRMAEDGWTAQQAMQEMHKFGYTWYHHFMCPGLARYEKSFPHRLQDDSALSGLRSDP